MGALLCLSQVKFRAAADNFHLELDVLMEHLL